MKLSVHLSYQIITTTKNKTNMTTETEFDYMSLYTMATFVEEKTEVETIINAEDVQDTAELMHTHILKVVFVFHAMDQEKNKIKGG